MPITPRPSKFICKNCGHSIIIIHTSDFFTEYDMPPRNCPKCKQDVDYIHTKADKKDLFFNTVFNFFK